MDKDNILSFEEIKKKKEMLEKNLNQDGVGTDQLNSLLGQLSDSDKEQIKNMFSSMDLEFNDEMKNQLDIILNAKSLDDIIENSNSSFFDMNILGKLSEKAKKANEKYKSDYKYYRELGQWLNVYKPYTLDKFILIEKAREIAKILNIEISERCSKNDIIRKIKPQLQFYLEKEFSNFGTEKMELVGKIIFNMGILHLDNPLTEKEEKDVDFFSGIGVIFRVNENGRKALIIPKEILDSLMTIDFRKFESIQKANTYLIKGISGLAGVYGVIPTNEGIDVLWEAIKAENLFDNKEEYIKEFWRISNTMFGKSIVARGVVSNAAVNENFIFHPMVGFVDEFYKNQAKATYIYKPFDIDTLIRIGQEEYFEDSIQMRTICDILNISEEESNSIKSIIYTFSKMEFEPQMVIAILETMVEIPIGHKYEIMMESLKNISKRSEKWVLKGYALGESTEIGETKEDKAYDPSKIINLDFHKK